MKEKKEYALKSYWLESCKGDLKPRPKFKGPLSCDVAILGAGYTGLWAAYYLLKKNPNLDIVILEKEIAGFGASGRNGGWCSPSISISLAVSIERYGKETTRNLQLAMLESVNEVEGVIKTENFDVDWTKGGSLQVALGRHGIPALKDKLAIYKKLGLEDFIKFLNKKQTDKRVKVNGAVGSLYTENSAVLNPAKLARQLAKYLERKGVKIYEQSEVIDYMERDAGNNPKLVTKNGTLEGRHCCILAGEAYLSRLPKLKRRIIPMYSLITLTEPLSKEQWSSIGWENRETVGSTRYSINYLQKTIDGRILFGGRGQPYRYASKIKDSFDKHKPTHEALQKMLIQWFPALKDANFTHSWGGPVGITRDWTPNIFYDRETGIASARGYVGQGVSTTNLAGRILSDLIVGKESKLTKMPMVQHKSRKWEIEPFRWIGARYVQLGLERVDRKSEKSGNPPKGKTLAERISRH